MFRPRWRKVLRDVGGNKTRTALVVMSIAVGVFAIGMIAGTQEILGNDLTAQYLAIDPASAILSTTPFDDDLVDVVQHMPEIRAAEGRRSVRVRVKVGPDQWSDMELFAIAHYNDIRVSKVLPVSGAWPPPTRQLLIERASLDLVGAQVGDSVVIEKNDGTQRTLRVAGLTKDINQPPAMFVGSPYGYITMDTLQWLGEPRDYNVMQIIVRDQAADKAHIQMVAAAVQDKIVKSGRKVSDIYIPTPGKHPASDAIAPLFVILGLLGFLSLLLSGFLVVNTIGAVLAQQLRQIGVMKTIGARPGQLITMYLSTVLIFGLLALLVGIPLGGLGAFGFSSFMASAINFDVTSGAIPPQVLGLQVGTGLVVPLLAALWPVLKGCQVSVRAAISDVGLGQSSFGHGLIDRALEHMHGLSRPLLLSLRNTFRRKGRLTLTLMTLTLSGTIFIGVFSVRDSLLLTLRDTFSYWNYDVEVDFNEAYRVDQIEREALSVPGVRAAESWGFNSGRRKRPNATESDAITLIAPPAQTSLLRPTVLAGRWLVPTDENALVVNTDLLKNETDLKVGDQVTLKIDGRDSAWQVVGLVRGLLTGPIAYANYPYFATVTHATGRSSGVRIMTAQHDAASQAAIAKALREHFEAIGMRVSATQLIGEVQGQVTSQITIVVLFLVVMALLLAFVGGLGLMGTMSINVLERTREIGVMRAIGASNAAVLRIVLFEGVLIGVLSWAASTIVALPLSRFMSTAAGTALLRAPLSYTFSITGTVIWLAVVVLLSALASLLPARNAARLTVRAVLAYE